MSELMQGLYRVTGQADEYVPLKVDANGVLVTSGDVSSAGAAINPDSADMTYNRNADGTVNYMQFVEDGVTYRKTFTWTSGLLTNRSEWVAQ